MKHHIGQRVSYGGARCTIRYIGTIAKQKGEWLGVEWDARHRGKHHGVHEGVKYFDCRSNHETVGSFIRPNRIADTAITVVEAVQQKYASGFTPEEAVALRISGKDVEEVGFEKIRQQMANLHELQIVVLDKLCVRSARGDAEEPTLASVCPNIRELDLGYNLFEDVSQALAICAGLEKLEVLKLDGNRFVTSSPLPAGIGQTKPFVSLTTLSINNTLLTLDVVEGICSHFTSLKSLSLAENQIRSIPASFALPISIIDLNLEENELNSLLDIDCLTTGLPLLTKMSLKSNAISTISDGRLPIFPVSLSTCDLTSNKITAWSFVDTLPTVLPGLKSLRIGHNPIYENEDDYILTLARLGQLEELGYSTITPKVRLNAETFYLSQIARELSAATNAQRPAILKRHPRYPELCDIYGTPDIDQHAEEDSTLAARMVRCRFIFSSVLRDSATTPRASQGTLEMTIPKSLNIYSVQGLIGKAIAHHRPLQLKLYLEHSLDELSPKLRSLGAWIETAEAVIRVEASDGLHE